MLSMIETAIEVTDAKVPASVIHRILEIGQDMLRHPIELLPHARSAVTAMAASDFAVCCSSPRAIFWIRNAS